jgi:hypothetical protein
MLNFEIDSVIVVSLFLLAAAAWLMISHVRAWRAFQRQQLNPPADTLEFHYRRRQYRRRLQTDALLGLLAIALSAGHFLVYWPHSNWFEIGFWGATMLLACWAGILAMVDLWATKQYFDRHQEQCLIQRAVLEAEARRLQGEKGEKSEK